MIFQVSPGRRRQHKEAGSRTKTISKEAQNRSQMCETTSHFQPPALELPQKVLQEVRTSEIAAKAPKSTRESFQEQARLASGTVFECPTEKSTSGEADLAPKTSQEGSRRPFGTPRASSFQPPASPVPTQVGPYCAYYVLDTWPGGMREAIK